MQQRFAADEDKRPPIATAEQALEIFYPSGCFVSGVNCSVSDCCVVAMRCGPGYAHERSRRELSGAADGPVLALGCVGLCGNVLAAGCDWRVGAGESVECCVAGGGAGADCEPALWRCDRAG